MKGFKNFLLQGDVVVIAIGLMVALAFNTLVKSFTDTLINPILNRFQGGGGIGLGIQLGDKGNISSDDLPAAASKCKYCGTELSPATA